MGISGVSHKKPKMEFSVDWFLCNIPLWETILSRYKGVPNLRYLEIGVYEGQSAFWMMDNILTGENCSAVLVDHFNHSGQTFHKNLGLHPKKEQFEIMQGLSSTVLKELPESSFDIVYIDGFHSAKSVLLDATLAWGLLKQGGYLIFDDMNWNKMKLPLTMRPELAISSFLTIFHDDIEIIHKDKVRVGWQSDQVIIEKKEISEVGSLSRIGNYAFCWERSKLLDKQMKTVNLSDEQICDLKDLLLQFDYEKEGDRFDEIFSKINLCKDFY